MFTRDDATHMAKSITYNPTIAIKGINNTQTLFEQARMNRYHIYQLTKEDIEDPEEEEQKIQYGILKKDFDKYWNTKNTNKIIAINPIIKHLRH